MLRIRITSVYMTRGTTAVTTENPVIEIRAAKRARLGIVKRNPASALMGG
jgi:hypothetical protein